MDTNGGAKRKPLKIRVHSRFTFFLTIPRLARGLLGQSKSMWIVALALRRPYTFTVFAILILIAGLVAITRTPKDIFPSINIPVISVLWRQEMVPSGLITPAELYAYEIRGILCDQDNKACKPGFGMMKTEFCIFGATRGTGLLIAQQLLEGGSSVRVLARDPDKARGILGNRVEVCHGDVTDPRSVRDAITKEHRAIFFTVAATGGVDGRGLFASETAIRKVTYQGLLNLVDAARSRGFQGRLILPSVMGADRTSVMIRFLDKIKSGLQRNLLERELYLKASGLDYAIVRAPILTNVPAGNTNIRIAKATNMLTAGPKISRGDLARVMILVSRQTVASRKTFDVLSAKGLAPSDQQLLAQIEQIPVDIEVR